MRISQKALLEVAGLGGAYRMAFVPENKQVTYRGGTQAACTACGLPVAWLRPKGIEVWCGVVSMSDVTDSAVESITHKSTGKVSYRIVAYAVKPGATLHACHAINATKYGAVYAALQDGTLKPRATPPAGVVPRGRRGRRAAALAAAGAAAMAHGAHPVPTPPPAPAVPGVHAIPGTTAVVIPTAPVTAPAAPAKKTLPDPALPPAALAAWTRAHSLLTKTRIHRILLYGPPGTGKTTFPHRMADELDAACYSITLTEETPAADLVGRFFIKDGSGVWLDGTATRAMRESHKRPVFLVLNEVDHASGDAMTKMIEILDDASLVALYLPTGEVVRPKPENWRIVCTSNAEPSALIPAVMDRLHANICITHPHPGLIASLYSREAKMLLTAASREFSVRSIISWDQLMREGWSLKDAANVVFEPPAASSLIDAARLAGAAV